VMQAGASIF